MASSELKKLWKRIRIDLSAAQKFIPKDALGDEHFRENLVYLEHNELELACDMLEETARKFLVTEPAFWQSLRDACVKMELYEKAAFYADIARGDLTIDDRYWNA